MSRKHLSTPATALATVLTAASAANYAAIAGEKIEVEVHTPLTQQTVSREYEPTLRGFSQEVQNRASELQSQPAGGSAWINRAEQPRETTTVTDTLKGDAGGFGGSVSHQGPPSTRSADEAALDQVQRR